MIGTYNRCCGEAAQTGGHDITDTPRRYAQFVECPGCTKSFYCDNCEALLGKKIECLHCGAALEMDTGENAAGELEYFVLRWEDVHPVST